MWFALRMPSGNQPLAVIRKNGLVHQDKFRRVENKVYGSGVLLCYRLYCVIDCTTEECVYSKRFTDWCTQYDQWLDEMHLWQLDLVQVSDDRIYIIHS